MTNEEYTVTQHQLMVMAKIINQMDLTKFLERIETTHAVGPILDPTLYRKGVGKMTLVQRVAEAALKFQKVTKEVLSEFKRLEEKKSEIH